MLDISDRINEIDEGVNAIIDTNGNDVEFGYALTGDGGLTKTGGGELTLKAENTFTGTTTIANGSLNLGVPDEQHYSSEALQYSTVNYLSGGGTLSFDSYVYFATLGGLTGSKDLELPAGFALTVGKNNDNTTYSGALTGYGNFIKTGTGTLTLTGASTYEGGMTIEQGTLVASDIDARYDHSSNVGNSTGPILLGGDSEGQEGVFSYTGDTIDFTRGFYVNIGGGEIDVLKAEP